MQILSFTLLASFLFAAKVHAAPCKLNAPYARLESDGQGCKYVPEVCRGLPEQLLARCLQTFTMQKN
ncbi:hypothetical protein FB451DRAFT_1407571 [Mycena latifolia]|nr:hypothetical protein FB451DRAFT_1407571 [Mycena latifolia]